MNKGFAGLAGFFMVVFLALCVMLTGWMTNTVTVDLSSRVGLASGTTTIGWVRDVDLFPPVLLADLLPPALGGNYVCTDLKTGSHGVLWNDYLKPPRYYFAGRVELRNIERGDRLRI